MSNFFYSGWGFDRLYNILFVKPAVWLSEVDRNDFIDAVYTSLARLTGYFNRLISRTQNGKLRWYVLFLTAGIVVLLTVILAL
jgi:NADH-quinone oxidoreductase subunit L